MPAAMSEVRRTTACRMEAPEREPRDWRWSDCDWLRMSSGGLLVVLEVRAEPAEIRLTLACSTSNWVLKT